MNDTIGILLRVNSCFERGFEKKTEKSPYFSEGENRALPLQALPDNAQPISTLQDRAFVENIVTGHFNTVENAQASLDDQPQFPTDAPGQPACQWSAREHEFPGAPDLELHEGTPVV